MCLAALHHRLRCGAAAMVVLSKFDSSHRKRCSVPDALNRCTTISPPPTDKNTPASSLDGPRTIPTSDIFTGDKTATSHIGTVRRVKPIPKLTDALIGEMIKETISFIGEKEAVLERVQRETRELASE